MSPIVTRWIDSLFPRRVPAARRNRLRPGWIEKLESRCLLTVTLTDIANLQMAAGKDTLVAVPATASNPSSTITYTVSSSNPTVTASVLTGGRSLKINVSGKDSSNANFTGDMTLRLFESETPSTTARIIQLVNSGFYTGLKFHRVVNNFVIQGGDPAGNGTGGSGTKFGDEFQTDLTFTSRGLLAMANSGSDTNDSQFFITDTKLPLAQMPQNLNFKHTIFGILTSGFDVYQKVITTPVNGETPVTNVIINSVSVFQDNINGVVRLKSATGSSGASTITVTANDGTGAKTETFTATTAPDTTNDRAFLGTIANQTTTQNTPVSFDVEGFDVQKDTLTFVVKDPTSFSGSNSTGNAPANLTSSIQVTPASGTTPAKARITLTPNSSFTGTISMIIGVRDQTNRGGTSLDSRTNFDTQQITLTVTAAVTKAVADSATVGENTAGNKIDVLANDTVKPGSGSLTITAVTQGAHGTVAIAADGKSLTFTPTKDYAGNDAFTYTVKDSQNATSTATVTLKVANNDRMFRLYNPVLNDYLFTITTAEYENALKNGYTDETTGRPGFSVLGSQATSSVTVFRLRNIAENLHYLTLSTGEKDFLVGLIPASSPDADKVGWKLESSGSFMYATQQPGTVEIFHLYNKDTGGHIFTDDESEVTQILAQFPNTWVKHNSLGFAFEASASSTAPASASLFSMDLYTAEQGQAAPLTLATVTQGEAAQSAPILAEETTAETGNDVPDLPQTDDHTGFGSDEIAANSTATSTTTTAPQSTITTIATIPGTTTAFVPDAVPAQQNDPAAFQSDVQWSGGDVEDAPETDLVDEVFSDIGNLDL